MNKFSKCVRLSKSFLNSLKNAETPSVLYSSETIKNLINMIRADAAILSNFKLYYSIKANYNSELLEFIAPLVDGFDCASVNEFRNVMVYKKDSFDIKVNSSAITSDFIDEVYQKNCICDFSSLTSLVMYQDITKSDKVGFRIMSSFSENERFGIDMFDSKLYDYIKNNGLRISRIHFHKEPLEIDVLESVCNSIISCVENGNIGLDLESINFGGGIHYVYKNKDNEYKRFWNLMIDFENKINNLGVFPDIILEPGQCIVSSSGYLVSSVIDVFYRNKKQYVVLDSSAFNLFSWFNPPLIYPRETLFGYDTIVCGNTNISSDIFCHDISLDEINIGDKFIFSSVGAYVTSTAKSLHMNSIPKEVLVI